MSDFCLQCCKGEHGELRWVADRRFVVSKYTSTCDGCGQPKNIVLGIKPKRKLGIKVITRHL